MSLIRGGGGGGGTVEETDPIAAPLIEDLSNDLDTLTAAAATDVELAAAVSALETALAAKQASSTAATDAELAAAVSGLQSASTAATDAELAAAVAAIAATVLASDKGFVNHGATAGTTRPTGYASIEWVGSVEPTNAVNGDTWINTA